jgi:four helix bundle protein
MLYAKEIIMAFRFETLDIWKNAREYATKVYTLTERFPRHKDYGLRSQMKRAVNSVGLNIAEGSVKSNRGFDAQLVIALGSCTEVVTASFLCLDRAYITIEEKQGLYQEGEALAKSVNAFRKSLR